MGFSNPGDLSVLLAIVRALNAIVLIGAMVALANRSDLASPLILVGLMGALIPLARGSRAARGTALRPALAWAAIALGMAASSQVVAMTEPFESGRPGSGQVVYLATLAALAGLISVLNARTPGAGAWGILMSLLVVVFLVPWLEGPGLVREAGGWDRLRLTAPWTIFYGLLVVAGVTNFLPTRLRAASVWLAIGFVAEFVGLTRVDWPHEIRGRCWTLVALCWACAAWSADFATRRPEPAAPGLPRLWAWFRDAWGVVWALRVQERFNRAAESAGWPIRLSWHGVVPVDPRNPSEIPPEAAATLAGLLRRFATPRRIEEASRHDGPASP